MTTRPLPRPQRRHNLRKFYEEELRKKYSTMPRERRRAIAKQATKMFMAGELGPPAEAPLNSTHQVPGLKPPPAGVIICIHGVSIRSCPLCSAAVSVR